MFLRPMNVNFGATISPRFIMEDRTSSHIAGGKLDFFFPMKNAFVHDLHYFWVGVMILLEWPLFNENL